MTDQCMLCGPSMEGRARARPNPPPKRPTSCSRPSFNGGPGTCPAKPRTQELAAITRGLPSMEGRARARPNLLRSPSGSPCRAPFNGGPGTCPAKRGGVVGEEPVELLPSMEGRARARPNVRDHIDTVVGIFDLQWRAGHVPGQTWPASCSSTTRPAFNGGPGTCPAKPAGRWPALSGFLPFNGGPGTCPAKPCDGRSRHRVGDRPSMEGRARARPNRSTSALEARSLTAFNGGPGTCPAKPPAAWAQAPSVPRLQWRAGHVPGQTGDRAIRRRAGLLPSMEGRARARPNLRGR